MGAVALDRTELLTVGSGLNNTKMVPDSHNRQQKLCDFVCVCGWGGL